MSMVQFNLLPDVKLRYIRTQATQKLVYSISFALAMISLAAFAVIFLYVDVLQKKTMSNADNDVKKYTNELREIADLDKILTIQNQLNALVGLHQSKHIVSRLYTYLPELTPANLNIGKLTVDFSASTLLMSGTADSLQTVNTFVDTMKFTTYSLPNQENSQKAFSSVILSTFGKEEKKATYSISVTFDPNLFANSGSPILVVPKEYTTRSVIGVPGSEIFNGRVAKPAADEQPTEEGQ